ncbi:phosphoethanolamine transferase domain-containing protein [Helicobacter sp. 23-1044]
MRFLKLIFLKLKFLKLKGVALNYHALLAFSIFALVCFYNDEVWLRLGEFIDKSAESTLLKYTTTSAIFLLLLLMAEILCAKIYAKIFIALLFIIAGVAGYFIDLLHLEMNADIIAALLNSDKREIGDFVTLGFALHLVLFVCVPLVVLYFIRVKSLNLKSAILQKCAIIAFLSVTISALYLSQGQNIIIAFRNNSLMRVANPFAPIRSVADFIIETATTPTTYTKLGEDATTTAKNKLFVLVIGESARAQNFAHGGYERDTNPHTKAISNLIYLAILRPVA